jgi:hypothetical protein
MKREVSKREKKIVIPLAVSPELKQAIEETTKLSEGMSEQAVMRNAIKRGLPVMKKMLEMEPA